MRNKTAKQTAEYFGYHPVHLKRLARDGVIPGERIGRRWMFNLTEVKEALKIYTVQDDKRRAFIHSDEQPRTTVTPTGETTQKFTEEKPEEIDQDDYSDVIIDDLSLGNDMVTVDPLTGDLNLDVPEDNESDFLGI